MRKKQLIKTVFLIQLISIASFFSTTTNVRAQVQVTSIKTSTSSDTEITQRVLISDGYQGVYWTEDNSRDPAIAVSSNGDVHVVYECDSKAPWSPNGDNSPGYDDEIVYTKYTASTGKWSNATPVSDGYSGSYWNHNSSTDPEITIDGLGTVHAVWEDATPGVWGLGILDEEGEFPNDLEILYANYTTTNGWSNATCISDGYSGTYLKFLLKVMLPVQFD